MIASCLQKGLLFTALSLLLQSGCGQVPDLKVQVGLIPNDTTQLWAIPWQGRDHLIANEKFIYELTPSAEPGNRTYSFGWKIEADKPLVLSVAAFKQTAAGFCIRTDGTALQTPNFKALTTVGILLDERLLPEGVAEICYPALEPQNRPLITGLTFRIERLYGSPMSMGTLDVKGWNFSPQASVNFTVNGEDLTPTNVKEIEREQPNSIRILLTEERLLKIQPNVSVSVTVTNPNEKPFVYTTKFAGS